MISLDAIRAAKLVSEPFRYTEIEGLLSKDQVNLLRTELPRDNYYRSVRIEGSDKTYNVINNVIFKLEEQRPTACSALTAPWRELLEDLRSPAYVDALSALLREDLSGCSQEMTIKRYESGDYISSHTDTTAVRATHLLYLNLEWESAWGGHLRFLLDETRVLREFAPLWHKSVAFVRSQNSWHDVPPVTVPETERLGLQVVFWNQSSRQVKPGRVEVAADG